jgi:hypothetical protein
MERIQIVAIIASLSFLASVLLQIKKGKLREEYAFVWILSTFALIGLSFWRSGLDLLGHVFGVYEPLNLIFTGAIFAILIYLLHLSMTISRLQLQNRTLAQEIVLLKEELESKQSASKLNDRASS